MDYKIVGHMTALNAMAFLPKTIECIMECVDLLLIVESSESLYQFTCNSEGLSTDGTTEYLEKLNKLDNVQCFHLGEVGHLMESRNFLLEQTPEDTDFTMKLDADEAFFPEEYKRSLRHLPHDTIGMSNHYHFWKDVNHIITSKHPSHWNNYKPRFVPYTQETEYIKHDEFTSTYLEDLKCRLPLRIYHFGGLVTATKVRDRLTWHNMKNEGFTNFKAAQSHALQHFYFTDDYTNPIYQMDRGIGIEIKEFHGPLPIQF